MKFTPLSTTFLTSHDAGTPREVTILWEAIQSVEVPQIIMAEDGVGVVTTRQGYRYTVSKYVASRINQFWQEYIAALEDDNRRAMEAQRNANSR